MVGVCGIETCSIGKTVRLWLSRESGHSPDASPVRGELTLAGVEELWALFKDGIASILEQWFPVIKSY